MSIKVDRLTGADGAKRLCIIDDETGIIPLRDNTVMKRFEVDSGIFVEYKHKGVLDDLNKLYSALSESGNNA